MNSLLKRSFCFLCICLISFNVFAGPWLLPGNLSVKSDIDLLADAGLIKAPVMTWPIAWVNIGPELLSPETKAKLPKEPEYVQQAYQRIVALYEQSYQPYKAQTAAYAAGSNRLNPFRTFQYEPYADFASGVSAAYQSKHAAGSINVSYYDAPHKSYSNPVHLDNSYAYLLLGNWAIGFDQFNRWWGPGYSDSLILSTNAPPLPTFTIQRLRALAPTIKWLHWLGPWSLTSSLAVLGDPRPQPNTLAWNTDFSFRPTNGLQFDIARVSLLSGSNRPLNGKMLWNLLTLQGAGACDPPHSTSYCHNYAPGKEHFEITVRGNLYSRWKVPLNLFLQTIFNDNIPYSHYPVMSHLPLPAKTAFLAGASTWKQIHIGLLRLYAEYEYTFENDYWFWGWRQDGIYEDEGYPYTYGGRILGSSLGNEAIGYTLGAILNEVSGNSDTFNLRYLELNADNQTGYTYSFKRQNVIWASFGRTIVLLHHLGSLTPELGYLISLSNNALSSGFSATITWSKNF